jgi:hypothetical protein
MPTTMHRFQVSLPDWQFQLLKRWARREGVSIAELIRRLVSREAESSPKEPDGDALFELAGIAEDHGPLLDGIAVSERPELYLTGSAESETKPRAGSRERR